MLAQQEYHLNMWRGVAQMFAVAVMLVSGALAQGVPASVSSFGFGGNNKFNGVPASVSSPGFGRTGSNHFFSAPANHQFQGIRNPNSPRRHDFPRNSLGGVYAVPYYIPVETDLPVDDTMEQVPQQPGQYQQPSPYMGGPTMFDRRGPGTAAYEEPVERAPRREPVREADAEQPAPAAEPAAPAADQPQTLLVFKDGHHVEVQNYAIVGDLLYDMTPGHSHKVLLADLDLDATAKQNDSRGIDFRLPPPAKAK